MIPSLNHIEDCQDDDCLLCDHLLEFIMCCDLCFALGEVKCDSWRLLKDGRVACPSCFEQYEDN